MMILKLLDGSYQLTKINLPFDPITESVRIPMTLNSPVYNEGRACPCVFWKSNERGTLFYKEVEPIL